MMWHSRRTISVAGAIAGCATITALLNIGHVNRAETTVQHVLPAASATTPSQNKSQSETPSAVTSSSQETESHQEAHLFPLMIESNTSRCDILQRSRLYSPACNNTGQGVPRRLLVTGTGRSGTSYLYTLLNKLGLFVSHEGGIDRQASEADHRDGSVGNNFAFSHEEDLCPYKYYMWRRRTREWWHLRKQHDPREYLHVFHLVRHPLLVMKSMWSTGSWKNDMSRCDTVSYDFPAPPSWNQSSVVLRRVLRHWVLWNSFVESYAERRYLSGTWTAPIIEDLYDTASLPSSSLPPSSSVQLLMPEHRQLQHNVDDDDDVDSLAQQVKPFGPIKSSEGIEAVLGAVSTTTNSEHTKKLDYPITWDMLEPLDRDYVIMAQLMALRYGFEVDSDRADEIRSFRQICGFTVERKWSCRLV